MERAGRLPKALSKAARGWTSRVGRAEQKDLATGPRSTASPGPRAAGALQPPNLALDSLRLHPPRRGAVDAGRRLPAFSISAFSP